MIECVQNKVTFHSEKVQSKFQNFCSFRAFSGLHWWKRDGRLEDAKLLQLAFLVLKFFIIIILPSNRKISSFFCCSYSTSWSVQRKLELIISWCWQVVDGYLAAGFDLDNVVPDQYYGLRTLLRYYLPLQFESFPNYCFKSEVCFDFMELFPPHTFLDDIVSAINLPSIEFLMKHFT